MRADFGIPYDVDALKLIDDLREWGLLVRAVVITRFEDQPSARVFKARLERRGVPVYTHGITRGYPTDVDRIVSERGLRRQRVHRDRAAGGHRGRPGPGQRQAGHLPLAGLPRAPARQRRRLRQVRDLPHLEPAAQAPGERGLRGGHGGAPDVNQIDPFHLEAYGEQAVNYNRDIEAFPLVARILERIGAGAFYRSPTDMGVNRAGFAIVDDAVVRAAAEQEVIRRYFRYACEYALGLVEHEDADTRRVDHEGTGPGRGAAAGRAARHGRRPPRARRKGKGNNGRLLRRRHRPARRPHRHGQELRAHARGLGRGPQRRQAPVRASRRHPPADAERDGVDRRA